MFVSSTAMAQSVAKVLLNKPRPLPPPTAAAFAMVRDILTENGPMHFREILSVGTGDRDAAIAGSSRQDPVVKHSSKSKIQRGLRKGITVPEGNPFISGGFLKNRILPVLESQQLIKKKPMALSESSVLKKLHGDKLMFQWSLNDEQENAAELWEQITKNGLTERDLSKFGYAHKMYATMQQRAANEAAQDAGTIERSTREWIAWENRPEGVTHPLELTHLSVRRRNKRPEKEKKMIGSMIVRRQAKREAEEIVKKEFMF